jgi:inhibitor of cysteine peptidase
MRPHLACLLLAAALAAPACHNPSADFDVTPLAVNTVEVRVLESFPVQVQAVIMGTLPTACSTVDSIAQRRDGNVVEITVMARTRREQFCILSLKGVTETVRLDGAFPPGEYLLRANGVESRFRV